MRHGASALNESPPTAAWPALSLFWRMGAVSSARVERASVGTARRRGSDLRYLDGAWAGAAWLRPGRKAGPGTASGTLPCCRLRDLEQAQALYREQLATVRAQDNEYALEAVNALGEVARYLDERGMARCVSPACEHGS